MLEKKILNDLAEALKKGDKVRVSALRLAISDMKNRKIEDRAKELEDDKVIQVLQKMLKKNKESIEQFEKGSRPDLVEKEKQEMAVLSGYIPAAMDAQELENLVSEVITDLKAETVKDMGKVMKEVVARVKGRSDGQAISDIVKNKLNK